MIKKKNKIDWSYEKEARIVVFDMHTPRNETIDVYAHYPDYVLKEVIFGHNIPPDKNKWLWIAWLRIIQIIMRFW